MVEITIIKHRHVNINIQRSLDTYKSVMKINI